MAQSWAASDAGYDRNTDPADPDKDAVRISRPPLTRVTPQVAVVGVAGADGDAEADADADPDTAGEPDAEAVAGPDDGPHALDSRAADDRHKASRRGRRGMFIDRQ